MESAGWQAPLLRLLVILSAALTLVPSNAAPAAASSSPVFLCPPVALASGDATPLPIASRAALRNEIRIQSHPQHCLQ